MGPLSGSRTYLSIAALVVVAVLGRLGYSVSPEWQGTIELCLGAAVAVFLRLAISGQKGAPRPASDATMEEVEAALKDAAESLKRRAEECGGFGRPPCQP